MIRIDRQVRDSSTDKSLHNASPRKIHLIFRIITTIKIMVSLRPNDTDRAYGFPVNQIFLIRFMPFEYRLGRMIHTTVLMISRDMMPPRLDSPGKGLDHPHMCFLYGFGRNPESRPSRLIHGHTIGY